MQKKTKLSSLYLPIMLVILFFIFVLVERIYTNTEYYTDIENDSLSMLSDEEWKLYNANRNAKLQEKSLIIYDHYSSYSVEIKDNIKYVLGTISVKTYTKDIENIEEEDDLSKYDTIIICVQNIDEVNYSFEKLERYVKNGGGLLFSVNLTNGSKLNKFYNLLGINKTNGYKKVESLKFNDNFLINSSGKSYGKHIINMELLHFELKDNVNIHISSNDDNNLPIVWDLKYGNGYVGISNSSLFSSKNGRGLFVSLYSSIHDVFSYPVINSAVYFIDDFPSPIPNGKDKIITDEYGYNIKDFYSNVWWPTMQELTKTKGIKFSSYIIMTYEDNVNGPFDNKYFDEESRYYIKQLLATGSEMGIHGYNHQPLVINNFDHGDEINYKTWPNEKLAFDSIRSVLNYTEDIVGEGKVISYVAPSNTISEELYLKMQEEIKEIKIYATLYVGDETVLDQEFDVLDNGVVNVPRLYSGMEMTSESEYMLLNELSYHYVFSHFMHPDDILDVERRSEKGFGYMTKTYTDLIDFVNSTKIRNHTVSSTAGAIQRYQVTSVDKEYINNKLTLNISGVYDTVYYFLKTNGKSIKNVSGCKYEKIADNYYLLTIDNEKVEIELE